jgi:hypothetical protein
VEKSAATSHLPAMRTAKALRLSARCQACELAGLNQREEGIKMVCMPHLA